FFFSSRRRHTRFDCDWSSDVCSSDLQFQAEASPQYSPRMSASELTDFTAVRISRVIWWLVASLPPLPPASSACGKSRRQPSMLRSEERRVGKECRSGGGAGEDKKKCD